MDFMPRLWLQNPVENPGRYGSWKFPAVLSKMQTWNANWYSNDGDVKIYSQKEIIAFLETVHFDVTCYEHTNSSSYIVIAKKEFWQFRFICNILPGGRKEKNRCRAGWFCALIPHIPAAVLRNQGRRFFLPKNSTITLLFCKFSGGNRRMPPCQFYFFAVLIACTS